MSLGEVELQRGNLLGLVQQMPLGGMLPKLRAKSKLAVGAENIYKLYEEKVQLVADVSRQELREGFLDWSQDRTLFERRSGKLVPSAMGLIVMKKVDGSVSAT